MPGDLGSIQEPNCALLLTRSSLRALVSMSFYLIPSLVLAISKNIILKFTGCLNSLSLLILDLLLVCLNFTALIPFWDIRDWPGTSARGFFVLQLTRTASIIYTRICSFYCRNLLFALMLFFHLSRSKARASNF